MNANSQLEVQMYWTAIHNSWNQIIFPCILLKVHLTKKCFKEGVSIWRKSLFYFMYSFSCMMNHFWENQINLLVSVYLELHLT